MCKRVILYTGKGGVGKSSLSAASAVQTAQLGRRTLLVSSDPAHNLGDILQLQTDGDTLQLSDTLSVLELSAIKELRARWSPTQAYFAGMLEYLGLDDMVAEEVALIPGMEELFLLARILQEIQSDRYDVVIVDCAPTADTLRLLTICDTAVTKLCQINEAKRRIIKVARPLLRPIKAARACLPDDEIFDLFDPLIRDISQLGEILTDPQVSSIRLVLNPQRVAIAETRRTFTYFGLYGFRVDGIFINKVLPGALADGYLNHWYSLEQTLLEEIERSFLDVAKFRVPLLSGEPIGMESLRTMAQKTFGDRTPDEVLSPGASVSIRKENGSVQLSFPLSGIDKEALDLGRKDDVLILRAGPHTRVFSLPDTLKDLQITGANFENEMLTLTMA